MIKLSENVRVSQDQEGAILLDVSRGKIYGLNPVASRIVMLLTQGLDEDQLKSEISREFSTDIESVRSDVDEFLADLARHQLILGNGSTPRNVKL
jgi:Coenzyme PQQ synthesis protein D (PqqD)